MVVDLVFALVKEITQVVVDVSVVDNEREALHHHQQSPSHFHAHSQYGVFEVCDLPACVAEPQSTLEKDAHQRWHAWRCAASC